MTTTRILFIATLVFLGDQISKWLVLYSLKLPEIGSVEIIPGFVNFVMAWNTGINFGLFASDSIVSRVLLIAFPIIVSGVLLWWARSNKRMWFGAGCALIIGGALANALDRTLHGAVVDFLNVTAFGFHNPFSFNIADAAIFGGAALVLFDFPSSEQKTEQETERAH